MKKKYRNLPPTSTRYCYACEEMRKFEYNKNIGHSECTECGNRFASRQPPEK